MFIFVRSKQKTGTDLIPKPNVLNFDTDDGRRTKSNIIQISYFVSNEEMCT